MLPTERQQRTAQFMTAQRDRKSAVALGLRAATEAIRNRHDRPAAAQIDATAGAGTTPTLPHP